VGLLFYGCCHRYRHFTVNVLFLIKIIHVGPHRHPAGSKSSQNKYNRQHHPFCTTRRTTTRWHGAIPWLLHRLRWRSWHCILPRRRLLLWHLRGLLRLIRIFRVHMGFIILMLQKSVKGRSGSHNKHLALLLDGDPAKGYHNTLKRAVASADSLHEAPCLPTYDHHVSPKKRI